MEVNSENQSGRLMLEPWANIQANSSASLYAGLRQVIRSGLVAAGQPLPSERVWAEHLQLSRKAVRAALVKLSSEGLVRHDATRVRRVAGESVTTATSRLTHTLALLDLGVIDIDTARMQPGFPTYTHVAALSRIYDHGYQALSCVAQSSRDAAFQRMLRTRPDGVLMPFDTGDEEEGRMHLRLLHRAGIPTVAHRDIDVANEPVDYVCTDHFAGGVAQAEYLLQRGCRRIQRAYRWTDQPHWLRRRDAGFEHALRQAGMEPIPALRTPRMPVPDSLTQPADFELVSRLLAGYLAPLVRGPQAIDALVTVTDRQIYETAAALRLLGLVPGKDVQILGYDNSWDIATEKQFDPFRPTASVTKHYREIGRGMVDMLVARLQGELPVQPQHTVLAPTLVEITDPTTL